MYRKIKHSGKFEFFFFPPDRQEAEWCRLNWPIFLKNYFQRMSCVLKYDRPAVCVSHFFHMIVFLVLFGVYHSIFCCYALKIETRIMREANVWLKINQWHLEYCWHFPKHLVCACVLDSVLSSPALKLKQFLCSGFRPRPFLNRASFIFSFRCICTGVLGLPLILASEMHLKRTEGTMEGLHLPTTRASPINHNLPWSSRSMGTCH